MKKLVPNSFLSSADAAFLYLERKEIPLHIASVSVFDGAIPYKEFVASIRAKLHLVPRYQQIVVMPPWNLGLPTWKDDPHFNIHHHIFRLTLDPPGGDNELEALAGRIFSSLLDRSKPLWDIHVVDGLKDGRGAIIWRMHHALADGVSGTGILKVMLDTTPEGCRPSRRPGNRSPRPTGPDSTKDAMFDSVRGSLEGLLSLENELLSFVQTLLDNQNGTEDKGLVKLLTELAASVERLPFNKPCTGERKFCWAEFDFGDLKAVREAVGGTVNDIVLVVLTRALARYVKLHGESVVNRFVRIVCPVSLRQGIQDEGLGNRISFLPVALPMDVRNPIHMLETVQSRTEAMKRSGAANLVGLLGSWIAATPAPVQALLWGGLPDIILPLPLMNMICTNVPGPPVPLYAVGRRMIASYPQVPTGYDLGVGCAVQSYDGKLFIGLIADAVSAPDVDRLRDFMLASFEELCKSAELEKVRGRIKTKLKTERQPTKVAKPHRTAAVRAVPEMPTSKTPTQVYAQAKDVA